MEIEVLLLLALVWGNGEENVYLNDSRITLVRGKGNALLKLTYGKSWGYNVI